MWIEVWHFEVKNTTQNDLYAQKIRFLWVKNHTNLIVETTNINNVLYSFVELKIDFCWYYLETSRRFIFLRFTQKYSIRHETHFLKSYHYWVNLLRQTLEYCQITHSFIFLAIKCESTKIIKITIRQFDV